MEFNEAYRQSLIPFKEARRMLYKLADIEKIPLDSSREQIEKFMKRNLNKKLFILSDYRTSLASDALLIAAEEESKLKKKLDKFNARLIEVEDLEDIIDWQLYVR